MIIAWAMLLLLCGITPATADWIVDINAVSNTYSNPLTLQLKAGSYTVTSINQASGGRYTAWNALQVQTGWWGSNYFIDVPGTTVLLWGGWPAPNQTAGGAFASAGGALSFSLSAPGTVSFGIGDSTYGDNIGGVSLLVKPGSGITQVPSNPRPAGNNWIVDINAFTSHDSNGVALQLQAGSYTLRPISQGTGGGYTAWNAGWETPGLWLSNYYVDLPGMDRKWFGGGAGYSDPGTAFANAGGPFSFTLSDPGTVYFGIVDSSYEDNFGGVSLRITSVPLPSGLLLLAPGLAGLAVIRKRFLAPSAPLT